MKLLKRIGALLLCMTLLSSMTLNAFAATQSAKAATLRLEKTQGTVTVQNASGTAKKATQNMKLLSGYTVSTGKASYAYISLDETKAIKLDASSKVSVQKAGKKLEVKLVSGKVMFNVSAPLTSQESLTIRTSTMVTGVRGTAGWVETEDNTRSSVYLLEGSLTVQTLMDNGTHLTYDITAGQQLTADTTPGGGTGGSGGSTQPTNFTEDDVPGFVATEVAENPELQKRMEEEGSPIDPNAVTEGAEEKLKQDEKEADQQEQQIQQQEQQSTSDAQETQDEDNTLFDNNTTDTPIGGGGGGGSSPTSATTLSNPTQDEIMAAFEKFDTVTVSYTKEPIMETAEEGDAAEPESGEEEGYPELSGMQIPEGKTLNLKSGTMYISSIGMPIKIYGTFKVQKSATLHSRAQVFVYSGATFAVSGTYQDASGKNLYNYGTMDVSGRVDLMHSLQNDVAYPEDPEGDSAPEGDTGTDTPTAATLTISGKLVVDDAVAINNSSSKVIIDGGEVEVKQAGDNYTIRCNQDQSELTIKNNGKIFYPDGNNAIYAYGKVTVESGTTLELPYGDIYLCQTGNIHLKGTLNLGSGKLEIDGAYATVYSGGKFINNGSIINRGEMTVNSRGTLTNNMLITNESRLTVSGILDNYSVSLGDVQTGIVNESELTISDSGKLNNYSYLANKSLIRNEGTILNSVAFIEGTNSDGITVTTSFFGNIINEETASIENFGTIENISNDDDYSANISNYGTILNGSVQQTEDGIVTRPGKLNIYSGTLSNEVGSSLNSDSASTITIGDGILLAEIIFSADSSYYNRGIITIKSNGTMSISAGGILINFGVIKNSGAIQGYEASDENPAYIYLRDNGEVTGSGTRKGVTVKRAEE